ncbi:MULTISPECIES: ferredoxin [unclassified Pseudofrankia]|uniref:ferredoxin n=1 Tax=unclassified Pseudofrankia TaxID=2994372 RepID=UPI0008DB1F9A|nr:MULTISPECIES: ferredoxin [unclassified Pseudofrankia]MDT3443289.1 ferredoxin [Pseudofrankia sp. BMG5.37]OHV65370.1 ferredoxin [Pseudofrankia sp. BMG5.36]
MKICIDSDLCAGHARCWETAPDLLVDDEDGRGVVRAPGADIPPELEAQARKAASVCPEGAVVLSN